MTYFKKPDHSYYRIIFEFTDKEMKDAGFEKLNIKPNELEILQLLQRISDDELNKTNKLFELSVKKEAWKTKVLRLIGFLNNKSQEVKSLQDKYEKLKKHLQCYGSHSNICDSCYKHSGGIRAKCTCGFDNALDGL